MTSTEIRTYAVRVFRDGDLWVIEVPELDTVSQSRTPPLPRKMRSPRPAPSTRGSAASANAR